MFFIKNWIIEQRYQQKKWRSQQMDCLSILNDFILYSAKGKLRKEGFYNAILWHKFSVGYFKKIIRLVRRDFAEYSLGWEWKDKIYFIGGWKIKEIKWKT